MRIVPAYWVCLAVTAFVAAPIGAVVHGGWSVPAAQHYLDHTYLLRVYEFNVGGTLHGAPFPDVWDALWLEFLCYLVVGVLYFMPVIRRGTFGMTALFALSTVGAVRHDQHELPHFYGATAPLFVLLPYFRAGGAAAQAAQRIRVHWVGALVSVGVLGVLATTHTVLMAAPALMALADLPAALPRGCASGRGQGDRRAQRHLPLRLPGGAAAADPRVPPP